MARRRRTSWSVALAVVSLVAAARAGDEVAPLPDLWKDAEFQRRFLGSYGVQSELEPKVSPIEREQMERILPLMGTDLAGAAAQLAPLVTPASSGAMDFLLGNVLLQLDRLDDAAPRFEEAIRKFPSFRRAWKNLGLLRFRQGKPDEAIKALTEVVELGGADAVTYGLLGYAYGAGEHLVAAESAFRDAMLLQPDQLDWKVGLAQVLYRERKYADAAAMAEELVAHQPDRADFWLLQANSNLGLGRSLEAAEGLEIVRRLGKATPATLYTLGDIYVNEGLWDLAGAAYAEAVGGDASRDVARAVRSVEILSQRGALPQAKSLLASLRDAAREDLGEDDRRKLLKLEARIAVAEGDGGDAVRVLESVVALDPLDGEALLLLGQHHAKSGDPDRALFYYERASGLPEFEAEAKLRQAQVLVGQSKYAQAVPLLKRAQEIRPRDDVGRYLEQVERVARSRR